MTVTGLFGGFCFRGLKKLKGGIHESTTLIKEYSKTEFGKKSSEQKVRRFTPVAGLIFETKFERYFLESFFLERNYCPRTAFSGSNSCSILSHPVISRNGSRADPCPVGRINYCPNVFSSWKQRNTPRFRTLLFGKEAVKTFFYKCSNSGRLNPLHSQLMGTKLYGQ